MGLLHRTKLDAEGEAFAALYRRHFGLVWSLTLHFGVPAAAREDVAQEVWLAVFRRLGALRPEASSRAWVASIARNVALHHHRTQGRRARKHGALTVVTDVCESTHPTDAVASIEVALRRMDPAQREVFMLVAVEALSGPEAADALGVPLNTVYSRLRLARARLAAAITDVDHDEIVDVLRAPAPPKQAANRMWLALAADLGWRSAAPTTVPTTVLATTWTGKLAVVAASALATVVGTAALGGRGDSSAHARIATDAIVDAGVVHERSDDAPVLERIEQAAGDPLPVVIATPAETAAPVIVSVPATVSAPAKRAAVRTPPRAARRPASTPVVASAPSPPADTLAEETLLIGRAQRALSNDDPALARTLLDRHAKQFADGALALDRRAAWARMLCAAGDSAKARDLAATLVREYPTEPAVVAVRDVCRAE